MPRQVYKKKPTAKKPTAKVVNMRAGEDDHEKETALQQAVAAEKNDDPELAEKLYKKQIQQKLLMLLYIPN